MDKVFGYQTDLDNLMLSKPGTFKDSMQTYKNSKVNMSVFNIWIVGLFIAEQLDTFKSLIQYSLQPLPSQFSLL